MNITKIIQTAGVLAIAGAAVSFLMEGWNQFSGPDKFMIFSGFIGLLYLFCELFRKSAPGLATIFQALCLALLPLSLIPSSRFTIQSFDWRVLKYMHEKHPDVRLVALRETPYTPQGVIDELGFVPAIFSPDYTMLNAAQVEFFHSKGAIVVPWTVNVQEDMKKLMDMKVDGIITDYPNLIIAKCPEGYNEFENKCVKIPTHAIASSTVPGWNCKEGHWQKRDKCEKIKMPTHSVLSEDGMSWVCKEGFKRYRDKCNKI